MSIYALQAHTRVTLTLLHNHPTSVLEDDASFLLLFRVDYAHYMSNFANDIANNHP